jgi:hypothetical protein
MPAAATAGSSEGDERVKADEGVLDAASIAAPARAAIAPVERIRETMFSSMTPQHDCTLTPCG